MKKNWQKIIYFYQRAHIMLEEATKKKKKT